MARKRTTAVHEAAAAAAAAAVAASQTEDEVLALDDPETAEIAEDVLEGLRRLDRGNRVTWYVYCDTPGRTGNSEGYIEKLRSEQLDEQRFKAVYGPGEYRLVGRTSDGSYVKGSHKTIKISDIGASTLRAGEGDAVSLLREMRAADEQRAAKRAEEMRTYAQILATPLATLGAALIARRPAIDVAALVTALRPQQSTLSEMTTALVNLKQLEGGGGANNVDTILKVLDRLQDLPAGSGGDTGWLGFARDLIREAAPAAREILGQMASQQRPVPVQANAVPPPMLPPGSPPGLQVSKPNGSSAAQGSPVTASSDSGQGPSATATQEEAMWRQVVEPWLRRKAEELHEAASTNMPIELEAERLLVAADKKFGMFVKHAELQTWLARPDWWEHVVSFHPPLAPYQAWLDDLRQELLAMIAEEGQPQESEDGAQEGQR